MIVIPSVLSHELAIFRNAYLSLLADSWGDSTLKDQITTEAHKPTELNSGSTEIARKFLVNRRLNELQIQSGTFQPLAQIPQRIPDVTCKGLLPNADGTCSSAAKAFRPYLEKFSNKIEFSWRTNVFLIDNEFLHYNPHRPQFRNGWSGGADVFVVKIPKMPNGNDLGSPDVNVPDFSKALMEYYRMFPTIFGSNSPRDKFVNNKREVGEIMKYMVDLMPHIEDHRKATRANLANDLGMGGMNSFRSFSAILLQMIAGAWSDPVYNKWLTEECVITAVGTPESTYRDKFVEFQNPWCFNIIFRSNEQSKWNGERWSGMEFNEIHMNYPLVPDPKIVPAFNKDAIHFALEKNKNPNSMIDLGIEMKSGQDVSDVTDKIYSHAYEYYSKKQYSAWRAEAIARYNNTGPEYPFSCC